jgi:hypothetical protein
MLALICMSASLLFITFGIADGWVIPLAAGLIMGLAIAIIFRFPSRVPAATN